MDCPTCTYSNTHGVTRCAMCDTPLNTVDAADQVAIHQALFDASPPRSRRPVPPPVNPSVAEMIEYDLQIEHELMAAPIRDVPLGAAPMVTTTDVVHEMKHIHSLALFPRGLLNLIVSCLPLGAGPCATELMLERLDDHGRPQYHPLTRRICIAAHQTLLTWGAENAHWLGVPLKDQQWWSVSSRHNFTLRPMDGSIPP